MMSVRNITVKYIRNKKKKIKIMINTPLTSKTSITSEGPSRVKKISSNLIPLGPPCGSQLLRDGHFRAVCLLLNSDGSPKFSDSEDISSQTWYEPDYKGLILGLNKALDNGIDTLRIKGDSKFLIDKLNGTSHLDDEELLPIIQKAQHLLSKLQAFDISWVPKSENKSLLNMIS